MHPFSEPLEFPLTNHAEIRIQQRRITPHIIDLVLTYGRTIHTRGTTFMVVGRKEVSRFYAHGIDLKNAEGVHVLLGSSGQIITAYRNHDLRKIRPYKRRHSFYH